MVPTKALFNDIVLVAERGDFGRLCDPDIIIPPAMMLLMLVN